MRVVIAGLLLCAAFGARAEWVDTGEATGGSVFYVDPATIKKTPNGYRAWMMRDSANPNPTFGSSAKILWEYDCEEERVRSLQTVSYEGPMGSGNVLGRDNSVDSWEYVIPGSTGEALLRVVCSGDSAQFKPDWVKLKARNPEGETNYMDVSTIQRTASGYRVWILRDRNTSHILLGRSQKLLNEYDCEGGRNRNIQFICYDGPMGRGRVVFTERKASSWSSDKDFGSYGEYEQPQICAEVHKH